MSLRNLACAQQRCASILAGIAAILGIQAGLAEAAPVYFAGTGHWYDAVLANRIEWDDALAGAATLSHLGETGYLATVTSQAEQDFLIAQFGAIPDLWLGGTDSVTEQDWFWVTGPEAGMQFYSEALGPLMYVNPANFDGGDNVGEEDYLVWNHTYSGSPVGIWGDYALGGNGFEPLSGYLVEFNGASAEVPEPASLTLLGLGAVGLVAGARRRRFNRAG